MGMFPMWIQDSIWNIYDMCWACTILLLQYGEVLSWVDIFQGTSELQFNNNNNKTNTRVAALVIEILLWFNDCI